MIYIYALCCPETGKPRYIGKTKNPEIRLAMHIVKARTHQTKNHCANWIRSVLSLGMVPTIKIIRELPDGADWQQEESNAIQYYREAGHDLTNSTSGGDGFNDMRPESIAKRVESRLKTLSDPVRRAAFLRATSESRKRPEVRKKMSESAKAVWSAPSHRSRMLAAMNTPEALAVRSQAMIKRNADPEYKARHSAKMKEAWKRPEAAELQKRMQARRAEPEVEQRRIDSIRAAHATEELKQRMRAVGFEIGARPEVKQKRSRKLKANWADPITGARLRASLSAESARAKMSASAKARWSDPEKSAALRERFADPESRLRRSEAAKNRRKRNGNG